ncbi:MAG: hypothetical protein ACXVX8_17260 [Blastococcus sp.]
MSRPVNDRPSTVALVLVLRVAGAALLAGTAWIHLHLWSIGYDGIAWIGPLFLVNAVSGFLLAAAVLAAPRRLLFWPAAAGGLLEAGTLGALALSSTVGLFGFVESTAASLFWPSVVVEAAGTVLLATLAVVCRPMRRAAAQRDWSEPLRTRG